MPERIDTYAATRPVPYLLERGRSVVCACPLRYGATGALVTVASGTLTVRLADGTILTPPVTIGTLGMEAAVSLPASAPIGAGYTLEFIPTIGATVYPAIRAEAFAGDYVPYCPISVQDVFTRETELRFRVPQAQGTRGDNTGWQPQVDDCYHEFIQRIIDRGGEPWRIRGVTGLREWLITRTCARCCGILSTAPDDIWAGRQKRWEWAHRAADQALVIQFDTDDPRSRRAGGPIHLAPVGRPMC